MRNQEARVLNPVLPLTCHVTLKFSFLLSISLVFPPSAGLEDLQVPFLSHMH